ncbi:MAG: DUF418 domain-containing protein [Chloroflexi bacterium]|nr:DUF418 domain-containing protein [Chloroflexota bacterium]
MNPDYNAPPPGPVIGSDRITSLDLIRGVAVLGILLMNAVSFKLGFAPYFNLSAGGSETWLDWAIGVFGEIFVDQKFMGLFSLLFGAGIMLFIERAETRESHPVLLNVWRNVLLLGIGTLHMLLWDGDVLMVYALSAFSLVALRKLSPRPLIAIGGLIFLLSALGSLLLQYIANTTKASLAGIWESADASANSSSPAVTDGIMEGLFLTEFFLRGLGLILMGAGLYRLGFMNGSMTTKTYKLTAAAGLGFGLPLAVAGVIVTALGDYSQEVAFVGQVSNTLGTIPASLGYMSLIILWDQRGSNWLKRRLMAAGRMALTNYLSQTILGVLILTVLLADIAVNRSGILLFCLVVWILQLWWSQAWLNRFRFGPAEWLWRVATYRRGQRLRRA